MSADATPQPEIIIRPLRPHEWPALEPIFRLQGHQLPPYSQLPAVVAIDRDGRIVGVILAHQWSVELEMFVDPACREQGVATRLAEMMRPEMEEMRPFTAYARNEASAALCQAFGLVEQEGRLFASEEL